MVQVRLQIFVGGEEMAANIIGGLWRDSAIRVSRNVYGSRVSFESSTERSKLVIVMFCVRE